MNKPVYLALSILDLSKTAIYEFWNNAKLCYMDADSFIFHVQTDDIQEDIAEDVETKFDTSNFEIGRPLPKGKNSKSNQINER